jgi:hypothetical protein
MNSEIKADDKVVSISGLTADTKPTDVATGSTFMELDLLKRVWMFSKGNVNPATTTEWWVI